MVPHADIIMAIKISKHREEKCHPSTKQPSAAFNEFVPYVATYLFEILKKVILLCGLIVRCLIGSIKIFLWFLTFLKTINWLKVSALAYGFI